MVICMFVKSLGPTAPVGLTRVESAVSTRGNSTGSGGNGGNQNGMKCLKCDSPHHLANSPECPLFGKPAHGLSDEVNDQCTKLIKEQMKTIDRDHVSDDEEIPHHCQWADCCQILSPLWQVCEGKECSLHQGAQGQESQGLQGSQD